MHIGLRKVRLKAQGEPMFQSEAHKRKLGELVKDGKISQAEYDRRERETGKRKLPDRVKPKSKSPKAGRR